MEEQESYSVTAWVKALQEGEADAAQNLWKRYFEKLVTQAEARIRNCPQGTIEAEDIAVSVFESLWRGANEGRFQNLNNRDELWWLLLALTKRKAASHIRKETALKRGGNKTQKSLNNDENSGYTFQELVSDEPTPEYLAMLQEEYENLLSNLRDDRLREIAVLRLEGYTSQEISKQLEISIPTVTRKLRLIRAAWSKELA
ncbi:ECF-type sigma factor [Gimesia fumaroli]|uniref:RNA polymerase sigma factor n=1 Tax=Gimesia fumaroli TaxID=2527976 RepID=A0A518IF69_9PLAN|nr:ECF-type sigma factor [Gimesia fumaroli]QDV51742.1 RNA polymerase sigma factor [Gimesia fumaroli]